jgi:aconitate hydratase
VAYAIAGRIDVDLTHEPLGQDGDGRDVFLTDLWPNPDELAELVQLGVHSESFRRTYADVYTGDQRWAALPASNDELFAWDTESTYVRPPPYFEGMAHEAAPIEDINSAHCLVMLGDSVTTDHISPAGAIDPDSPAGHYLLARGIARSEFNSYGSRRGNHEVMVRGTFANVRLRNFLAPGREGPWTVHVPSGDTMSIFTAAERYAGAGTPCSSSPAGNTARALRATGPPRGLGSWASVP